MSKSNYQHQKKAIARYEDKLKETHTKIQIRAKKELKEKFEKYISDNGFENSAAALENLLNKFS